MILDSGILTVFRREDVSQAGSMPVFRLVKTHQSWYGKLAYETAPVSPTDRREDVETSLRVRILRNDAITNHNIVILRETDQPEGGDKRFDITRAYHGTDDDSGELITDLTLREVEA